MKMSTASKPGPSGGNGEEKEKDEETFECNICFEAAKDPVVSLCGHLFCWPCLHRWLETIPSKKTCPVCKAAISKEKVVPLYGRGSTQQNDPRQNVPPRPAGQRTEPESNGGFPGFGFGDGGLHMSFGIGAFPFGLFTSSFTLGDNRPSAELIDGDSEDFEEMGILTDSSTEGEEYMAGIASAEEEVALSESEEDEVPISVSEDEETATTFMSEDEDMRTCVSESSCTDDDVISFM